MEKDRQLFKNTDQQEAIYAPHELPEGSAEHEVAATDDRGRDANTTTDRVGVPAAGAGLLSQASGGIGASAGATNPAGAGSAAAAPEDTTTGPDVDDD